MEAQQQVFFDFLRFSVQAEAAVPRSLAEARWDVIYDMARKQGLVGVLYRGVRRLTKGVAPDEELLMRWTGQAERIRRQNVRLFEDSATVWRKFRQEGFRGCVLKGQGNALLYPDPYMRTAGDIDIYLEGGRRRVMRYVDKVCPHQVMRYHHVDFPVMRTPIEVHFTPSYMFFPVHNRRMQAWFRGVMDLQCSNVVTLPDGYGEMAVPTVSFNVVYILSHLYRHVFTEGIGLRQLLDYYYVLLAWEHDAEALACVQRVVGRLGMTKFAGGIMWVLGEVFGLPSLRMIAMTDEREGRFLLDEIMQGGNFGQYDTRLGSKDGEGKVHRYLRMSLRNLRFVRHYPAEALSEPLFRTCFAVWKMAHGAR